MNYDTPVRRFQVFCPHIKSATSKVTRAQSQNTLEISLDRQKNIANSACLRERERERARVERTTHLCFFIVRVRISGDPPDQREMIVETLSCMAPNAEEHAVILLL